MGMKRRMACWNICQSPFPSPESLITVTPNLRERWDSRKTGSDKRERKDILDRIMDSIEVSSSFVWACSLAAILY